MKIFNLNLKMVFAAVLTITALWGSAGVAFAQTEACDKLREQIIASGFDINQLPSYCTTESVYNKFLNGALFAVGIVAVIAIIYGGYIYMTAQSNDVQRKKGRDILTWAIIGLAIVLVAVLLVNVVINLIVENKFV